MKTYLVMFVVGLMAATGIAAGSWWLATSRPLPVAADPGKPKITQGPPILTLVQASELVSLKININQTLEAENNWYRGAWMLAGDALIATDCSQITVVGVNHEQKTFVMRVPNPRVISCRVDHSRTKKLYLNSISWNPAQLAYGDKNEIIDNAMKEAQAKLERIANTPENIKAGKEKAAAEFERLSSQFGWKASIAWFEPTGDKTDAQLSAGGPR